MRVLHLLSSTGFHGAENMAAALIPALAAQGVENYVGLFRSHDGSNIDLLTVVKGNIAAGAVFDCRGKIDVRAVLRLRKFIREHRIDVVHSHKYKTNFYAALACLGFKVSLISTCHNWLGVSAKMRFYAALDKRVLATFDRVVGVSEEVTVELRRHVRSRKVLKIDNGIDLKRFETLPERARAQERLNLGTRPVIGFVGRLTPDKAVSDLLKAVDLLRNRGKEIDVLVVGDGESAEALYTEARTLKLEPTVHFLGRRDDTPVIYAAMDAFVLPSIKEAFPMVVLEAMACGVPVVATRVGDIPYMLEEGACGCLIAPGDVDALSRGIENLIANADIAHRMASAGQQRARDNFSSAAMARRYVRLYADTLPKQPTGMTISR